MNRSLVWFVGKHQAFLIKIVMALETTIINAIYEMQKGYLFVT
jgi:hypothetical protein